MFQENFHSSTNCYFANFGLNIDSVSFWHFRSCGKPHNLEHCYHQNNCENWRHYFHRNIYEGAWVEGQQTGHGKLTRTDGTIYTGSFLNGSPHGNGVMKYANGDEYRGEWKEGKHHGRGLFTWSAGASYEGMILEGEFNGEGVYKFVG
eukprot:gene30749-38007_t